MNKDKILEWIEKSIQELTNECDYNEKLYKEGKNKEWISKDNGDMFQPMCNYYGYMSLVFQLNNIKKLINSGEFDE